MRETSASPKTTAHELSRLLGWMLGAGFLLLALLPTKTWLEWFLHPLNTDDGAPGAELESGVNLLRIMLPVAGLCWLAWTFRLQKSSVSPRGTVCELGWKFLISAVAVLLLGLTIRLPLLEDGLWYDEIASFWYYGQFGPGPIIGNMFTPANHTLQTLGSWVTVMVSGGSLEAEVLRLPSLMLGLATIWPMSMLARDGFRTRPFMLLSIALLMLCPVAILESTEARGYAFMLFFGTSSSALLLRYQTNGNSALLPFYALVSTLGIWSHLVTVVVPMGHALFLAGTICFTPTEPITRSRSWVGLCAIGLAAITTLTLLAPTIPEMLNDSASFSASRNDQPGFFGREGADGLLGLGGAWSLWGGIPGLLLVCLGCLSARKDKALRRTLLITGLPTLIAVSLVCGFGTWIYARFLVFGITFSILAVAAGIRIVWLRSEVLGMVASGLLLLGWGNDILSRYQIPRQPIREIMTTIPNDGSGIGFIGITDLGIILSWYADDPDRITELDSSNSEARASRQRKTTDWIVIAYPSRSIPETNLLKIADGLETSNIPTLEEVIEGYVVRRLEPGWIDDDGSVLLLERTSNRK